MFARKRLSATFVRTLRVFSQLHCALPLTWKTIPISSNHKPPHLPRKASETGCGLTRLRWGESYSGVLILKPESGSFFRNIKLFQGNTHQCSTVALTKKHFVEMNSHLMLPKIRVCYFLVPLMALPQLHESRSVTFQRHFPCSVFCLRSH